MSAPISTDEPQPKKQALGLATIVQDDTDSDDDDPDSYVPLAGPPTLRHATVQLTWGDGGTIRRVWVGLRPMRPFTGTDGRHVTAWSVLVDTVRRRLIGKTHAQARVTLSAMFAEVYVKAEHDRLTGLRQQRFDAAAQLLRDRLLLRTGTPRNDLAHAVAAYLTCRNLAPFANVDTGQRVTGDGESAALRPLREYESTGDGSTPAELRTAIWALIDDKPVAFALGAMSGQPSADSLPGFLTTGTAAVDAVHEMFLRHLREIARAYPIAYRDSGLHDNQTFTEMWAATLLPDQAVLPVAPAGGLLPPAPAAAGTPGAPPYMPVGWSSRPPGPVVAVHVGPDPDDGEPQIQGVTVAGRGHTLFGSRQHHHLTASVAVVQTVRRMINGYPPLDALGRLLGLAGVTHRLATCPEPNDDGVPRLVSHNDLFNTVWDELSNACDQARVLDEDTDDDTVVAAICDVAGKYLRVRNLMPLASVTQGSVPSAKNELFSVKVLHSFEANPVDTDAAMVAAALWGLLDVDHLHELTTGTDRHDFPGASPVGIERVVAALSVHCETVRIGWPTCYASSGFTTTGSLAYLFGKAELDLDQPERNAIAHALGFQVRPFKPVARYASSEVDRDPTFDYSSALADLNDDDLATELAAKPTSKPTGKPTAKHTGKRRR